MSIDFDKMKEATRSLLEKVVRVQIQDKPEGAEKLVKDTFVWTKEVELLARTLRKTNKTLNGIVKAPLAEHLLRTLR